MPGFVVILFWLWFAISMAILIYRLATTGTIRSGDTSTDETTATPSGRKAKRARGDAAIAARQADFDAELAAMTGADVEIAALDALPAPTPPRVGELDFDAALAEAIDTGPAEELTYSAPDREPVDPTDPNVDRARSLAEALEGIHMPADLAPIPGEPFDPRRMLFSTETTPPASVGGMLADELERLGYTLTPLDDRSIAAVGPAACVEVRILPDDELGLEGMLAGRVNPGTVVTEFQLV
ncbi:MAG: hypothetical protein AAGC53_09390 [Actinomycetota bacterium]